MNKFHRKKRGRPRKTSDSGINNDVQDAMLSNLDDDFAIAKQNMDVVNKDFDDYYNMIHCVSDETRNDWETDIFLPEFVSRILTQIGNFVAKYFSSRDFVEIDADIEDEKDYAQAKAAKTLLNTILNQSNAYYFQKIVRLLMFVWPSGWGVIKGSYRQKVEKYILAYKPINKPKVDDQGNFLASDGSIYSDPYTQSPAMDEIQEPIYDYRVIEDRPFFDVYPNQNVYFSPEYSYSLQEKEYVIFENDSMTLDELKAQSDLNGYFNLNLLEDVKEMPTQNVNETSNKDGDFKEIPNPPSTKFRVLEWWRKYPVIVKSKDDNGRPIDYEPGLDRDGNMKEGAELHECIITTASKIGTDIVQQKTLIGFRVSPHTKRPMVRFLCYIDAIKDSGFGDGEINFDLQTAINDNFNLGNFRTKLATTPAFKSKRFSGIPNKIKVSPEEAIELENMEDLQELLIKDDISGTMLGNSVLTSRMDYAMATSPQTMGHSPENTETATQASIVSQRAEVRIGMKTTNLEFIGFTEFYDMILTLCNDFMLSQTLERLIGDQAFNYNPNRMNRFKPVSQSLETEESKSFKMRMIDQILGRIVNFPNAKTPMVMNYLIGMWLELAGGEFKHFKKFMFSEDPEINLLYQMATGGKIAGQQQGALPGGGPSNQNRIQQSTAEQTARAQIGS